MRINNPRAYRTTTEANLIAELLDLKGKRLLELGCGAAAMTRLLAERFDPAEIVATEVDGLQHDKNLGIRDLPKIRFRFGGAEAIDDPDGSYHTALLFKSLHHVPMDLMAQSLREIHRVLKPGGQAWICEPVYWGPFNDLLRLFHDEREVREAAFSTLRDAVDAGLFELQTEAFFQVAGTYENWQTFEERYLKVTHTKLDIGSERYARIQSAFESHMKPGGARFLKPHRVDLLRKPD
jgi:ubiquinone/menaquinone biosynthesis C-methylase UbiE